MQTKFKHFLFGPLLHFGISQRLQITALWSMLEAFSNPLFSLLLIPIFTHNLALENYGLYVMVMAFVNFFGFTGLGMSTSITYYLAVNHEKSSPEQVAERLGSALLMTLLGTMMFSCLFLWVFYLCGTSIKANYPQLIAHQQLIYLGLLLIVITQLDSVVSASLKGIQQFKISSKVEFSLRLISFIVIAIVAVIQKNTAAIVLVTLVMSILNLVIRYLALSQIVTFCLSNMRVNKKSVVQLFHFGKWMTLQNISGAIFNSLDKLFLGFYYNTRTVGIYNIIVSVAQLTHFVLAGALAFLMAKITVNKNNNIIIKQYYFKSQMLSGVLVLVMMFILALVYPYVEAHFNLDQIKYEYYWLLLSYGLLAMSVAPYYILLGIGEVKLLSIVNTLSALIGMLYILQFVGQYQIYGAVSARFAYTLTVMVTLFMVQLKLDKV